MHAQYINYELQATLFQLTEVINRKRCQEEMSLVRSIAGKSITGLGLQKVETRNSNLLVSLILLYIRTDSEPEAFRCCILKTGQFGTKFQTKELKSYSANNNLK